MAFESLAVANEILKTAKDRGINLTPLQLQKLVYFAHGWCLGLFDRPLIDEQVEAWPYGPVIQSIYHEFKKYGNDVITRRARRLVSLPNGETSFEPWDISESRDADLVPIAKQIIGKVVELYGQRPGVELSGMTHARGTPWRKLKDARGELPKGTDIPEDYIKEYFKSISAD